MATTGVKLALTINLYCLAGDSALAQAVQAYLKDADINLVVNIVDMH